MATATMPKNQSRVMKQIIGVLTAVTTPRPDDKVGHSTLERAVGRCWICNGTPSSTAPTGMNAGDLILDYTNDEVYRYISSTTYVNVTADS